MTSTWKIYILAIISFLVGTSEYIVSGILDKIADSMGITVVAAGQLITVFSLTYAIATPVLMALTARWDRRRLMITALGIFVVANILSFVLPGYELLLASRILMALGAGMVVVTALSIAAKIAPEGKQAGSLATVIMGFTASLIIGVPLGRMVAAAFGWKAVFIGIALLGIVAMLIISVTIPRIQGDAHVPLRQQFSLLKNPRVALGLSISFFWLGGYSVAYTYLSPYLLQISGLQESLLSTALLAFGIASLVGSKVGGFSADKKGVTFTLLSGMTLHVIALILLSLAGHSAFAVFAILILWSFAAWSTGPAQQYNLVTIKPESSGVMLGLNQSMMQLSMAAGAGIGGVVVSGVSLSAVTWIGAVGVLVAMLALLGLNQLSARRKVAATE
ncbi:MULTISPECIES: MFS transporter [Paenibacillus]|uniref:MFS-type transporter YbcL n=1 Tax=Paenibacillus cineris TaxID=237530 RepID=A0ABQ4LB20_9BACL|nr:MULTISPECIES: MFS transporter [Paenibacillus]OXL83047.1 MFS transporter [Paenibacillus sp. SSG-1]GIO53465.1 putative MFS-type transporter YbcL [Paenibacillus cineris]